MSGVSWPVSVRKINSSIQGTSSSEAEAPGFENKIGILQAVEWFGGRLSAALQATKERWLRVDR